jgi:3-methyladenine DNA glycosylase AlkD
MVKLGLDLIDMLKQLQNELRKMDNPQKAKLLAGYFKTGKGEYGEGDMFLGLTVPVSRKIATKFIDLSFPEIKKLLLSKFHEERLVALLILVHRFKKGSDEEKKTIYEFYLKNTKGINNWDLVDLSSHEIVGVYLLDKDKNMLIKLAKSKNIWEKRIAVISTFEFIRNNKFDTSLVLAKMLLHDKHDLLHKAVGWMLREIGKRDLETEIGFLDKHYKTMPRTMLRYSIEKFPKDLKQSYMSRA